MTRRKYPHIQQHDEKDCGAACLSMILSFYGAKYTISKIREIIKVDNYGVNIYGIVRGSDKLGLNADALKGEYADLISGINNHEFSMPFIARIINEFGYEHFIVVYNISEKYIIIGDPAKSKITRISTELFKNQWQKQIIIFQPNDKFVEVDEIKGSFTKYFKFITSQKKNLFFVFVMSLIISVINISGSIVFQYVINDSLYSESHVEYDGGDYLSDYSDSQATADSGKSRFIMFLEKNENKLDIIFSQMKNVCIFIICLYFLRFFVNILRGYILAITSKKVDIPITIGYYNHLLNLPVGFYGSRKTGEYMSRFSDASNIRDAISSTTLTLMLDTMMAFACGLALLFIDYRLFFITIVILVIYTFIVIIFKKPIKTINHSIMESDAQVTSFLKESIDGIETIKTHNFEENAKNKTYDLYNKLSDKSVKASVMYSVMGNIIMLIESSGIVLILGVGSALCYRNIISLTDLILFYYLVGYFLSPVKNLIDILPNLQTAVVAAERLNDILDTEPEDNTYMDIDSLEGDIELENVFFRYGNRELVLNDITMKFECGKRIAIVGESGCGKTTIAKLLMAFYKPEDGTIKINGKNIFDYSPKSIRNRIAYVSQDVFLFSDTIYNNLRIGNKNITDKEIEDVCKLCFADEFITSLAQGYNTVIEENGNNFSGGQKQRLAIARALLRKPDILILDEATSNLDTITEKSIKKTIDILSKKITCILIAHRLNTIRTCDCIYVMKNNSIVEFGTHDYLISQKGFYASLDLNN